MTKFDERDIMFSRMSYQPGTWQYDEYYKRNPEKKEPDDILRKDLDLLGPGSRYYHPLDSALCDAAFRFLADIKPLAEGSVSPKKTKVEAKVITEKLKEIAALYGACLVGITRMGDEMFYSHRGRIPEVYGKPVSVCHQFGIAFAVEMDSNLIRKAPKIEESVAVTHGYVKAAVIGMVISYYIRALGYDARNHMDGNYLVIAPKVAASAGLGSIGRNGLLLTQAYGPRVRLGVVTTDLELVSDPCETERFHSFCQSCGLCAKKCPGQALSHENDFRAWKVNAERCFQIWKEFGTDCGVCIASCPYSHR